MPYKCYVVEEETKEKKIYGEVSHEVEVNVAATKAWELYSTLKLAELVREKLLDVVKKVELLQGNGGVGTVFKLTFRPDFTYKERFTKMDHENRVKEAEVFEGGYLDIGFTVYRVRFQVLEKNEGASCIIKATIQYEFNGDAGPDPSNVTI